MTTTSLKLSDELKQRTATAAQQLGISAHAFMLNAIEQATTATEQRAAFLAQAHAALDEVLSSGKGYAAADVHGYIKARAAGKNPAKPKARSWRG